MDRVAIDPLPPVADVTMPWDAEVPDPVAALGEARALHGDTFVVEGADDRYLFVFSPVGVRSFYGLAESDASKGVADLRMLTRKLPGELFDARRTFPHELFGREDASQHLDELRWAAGVAIDELGPSGSVDLFGFTRRLGHRLGLAAWATPACAHGPAFEALVEVLDDLDGSDAFVRPGEMAALRAGGHAAERAALETVIETIEPSPFIRQRWSNEADEPGRRGAALDTVLVHIASMSNLHAALGWTVGFVVATPGWAEQVRADGAAVADRCALEAVRLAQRSIMMRYVLRPVSIETETGPIAVEPGATVATLLPLTNQEPDGFDRFDPDRWSGRRLVAPDLAARELVTTFGHGSHTCPAQPFSVAALSLVLTAMLERFDLRLPDGLPGPLPGQIGGMARPAGPCRLEYRTR